ncbi:MAG: tetratricopeptide repeat protein [Treponemataceae bacterium]|nr:tetratricopeptide repeat protein [Treponemataceae bacterium]
MTAETDRFHTHRPQNTFWPKLITGLGVVLVAGILIFVSVSHTIHILNQRPTLSKVYRAWDARQFETVYALTDEIIRNKPFEPTAEAYHGFAAFYLAVSSTDPQLVQQYIDESINSLRLARPNVSKVLEPQVTYLLGKAYFYKDSFSSYHYYADLAIYYLQDAFDKGVTAADIPEYLGLSYAQLGYTEESISSFSEALLHQENDTLLLAIGEQYIANGQSEFATQYLYRLLETSKDEVMQCRARLLIASVMAEQGQYAEAENEYNLILEKDLSNADAYYGIGVLYEMQGDLVKARSFWRKALKVQVTHQGALQKLGK